MLDMAQQKADCSVQKNKETRKMIQIPVQKPTEYQKQLRHILTANKKEYGPPDVLRKRKTFIAIFYTETTP
jgi:hypothetical protein